MLAYRMIENHTMLARSNHYGYQKDHVNDELAKQQPSSQEDSFVYSVFSSQSRATCSTRRHATLLFLSWPFSKLPASPQASSPSVLAKKVHPDNCNHFRSLVALLNPIPGTI